MKAIVFILLLAAAGFIGYQQWTLHQAAEEAELLRRAQQAAAAAAAEPAGEPTQPKKTKVRCPKCKGEGRLTFVNGRDRNQTYACPICSFVGSHEFEMPAGASICPDCMGMGKVERDSSRANRISSSRCARCSSLGYVRPRSATR